MHRFNLFNSIWCIDKDFAMNFLPLVASYIKNAEVGNLVAYDPVPKQFRIASKKNDSYHLRDRNYYDVSDVEEDSVGIIDISGAITKEDRECEYGSGTKSQSNILRSMYASDYIKGIVLHISSGGGEGYAMRQMVETIRQSNKPVTAFVDDLAASAAYGIAAACDLIVCNSDVAQVGSIGTYCSIIDYTEYFEKLGISIIDIYATKSTEKNKDFYEAIKGNTEPLRKKMDVFNEMFISTIKEHRTELGEEKEWGKGQLFFAPDAQKMGLIDEIDTFENVLNYF